MKKIYFFLAISLFYNLGFSQGNDCGSATLLPTTGQYNFYNNGDFPNEVDWISGDTSSSGDNGGNTTNDVFFSITPGSVQTVNIGLCLTDASRDTKLVIYSDCTLTTIVAENDNGGTIGFDTCGQQGKVSFQSDGTSTYIIMVEGADSGSTGLNGAFKISLWYQSALTLPTAADGVDCSGTPSGAFTVFSSEFDAITNAYGDWTGDVVENATSFGDWEINPSGLHSADTGPSAVSSSTIGTSYMSYEGSEAAGGSTATASAVSPEIDLSVVSIVEEVELSFYMHAYGIRMGILNVGISTTGAGGPFTNVFTWSGQLQSIETQDWIQVGVDLFSYKDDKIHIEFEFTGIGDFHSDMAIDLVEVTVCDTVLSVDEEGVIEGFSIYPNPATDILNFKAKDYIDEISIYNLLGQEILRTQPRELQTQIDISSLPTGMYIVKTQIGEQLGTYRVVKQ